jgi:ABC-type oligopeptide transport system substrate-binding subunit
MRQIRQTGRRQQIWLVPLFVITFGIVLFGLSSGTLAAQDSGKSAQKTDKSEQPVKDQKAQKKIPKEEEEEPAKPKRRTPIRVGDEEMDENASADESETGSLADLEREAAQAKDPKVKDLYQTLSKPHDIVTLSTGGIVISAKPISTFVGTRPDFRGNIVVKSDSDKPDEEKPRRFSKREVSGVDHFEHLAVTKVNEFLKGVPDSQKFEMLQHAERALEAVVRFHESALKRKIRDGQGWSEVKKELLARLQAVQLDKLQILKETKNWPAAFALATDLTGKYSGDKEFQNKLAEPLAALAAEPLGSGDYVEVGRRVAILESIFPNHYALNQVRNRLKTKAEELRAEAEQLQSQGKSSEAFAKIRNAQKIYPPLPGISDLLTKLASTSPMRLVVAVRELPENLSPALAYTDSEKQAVELLFEGLIKLTPVIDPAVGQPAQRISLGLAAQMPRQIPLGRSFQIAPNAHWSDGSLLTVSDIRRTAYLLCDPKWSARDPEWAQLMSGGDGVRSESDGLHVSLSLTQGILDPLSQMDFKIVPEQVTTINDPEFAKHPVGSGPYKFQGRDEKGCTFVANPYFEGRPGKTGLPAIREIRFVQSSDPAKEFQSAPPELHVLLDVSPERYIALRSQRGIRWEHLRNQRIYFLAVNHRKAELQSERLRKAIACAIDRSAILRECFNSEPPKIDRPLTGPYPPGTWACSSASEDLLDVSKAKAHAKNAKPPGRKLSLKYPADDPAVKKACEQIRKQVEALDIGITLELEPRSPHDLRRDVEGLHEFDLAYYSYDYPTPAYWLWPLFDPQGVAPGGRNYLGYQNPQLDSYFHRMMAHRDFAVVCEETQHINALLKDQMPLIPLWQLDTHIAIHDSVKCPDLSRLADPLMIFADIEKWSIKH